MPPVKTQSQDDVQGQDAPRNKVDVESDKVTQLRNEQNRLSKEIDILKIEYEKRQRLLADQHAEYQERQRVDLDKIARQLEENRVREDKLTKTQSEVNQLRAQIEAETAKQKDLLLRKEVELDANLAEVKKQKEDLAARLAAKK